MGWSLQAIYKWSKIIPIISSLHVAQHTEGTWFTNGYKFQKWNISKCCSSNCWKSQILSNDNHPSKSFQLSQYSNVSKVKGRQLSMVINSKDKELKWSKIHTNSMQSSIDLKFQSSQEANGPKYLHQIEAGHLMLMINIQDSTHPLTHHSEILVGTTYFCPPVVQHYNRRTELVNIVPIWPTPPQY